VKRKDERMRASQKGYERMADILRESARARARERESVCKEGSWVYTRMLTFCVCVCVFVSEFECVCV